MSTISKNGAFSINAGYFLGRYVHFKTETPTSYFRSMSDMRHNLLRFGIGLSLPPWFTKKHSEKTDRSIVNDDVIKGSNSNPAQTSSMQQ